MQPDHTLSWILPFVRESLRGRSSFDFNGFIDPLWRVLSVTGVPGIEKNSPTKGYTGTEYDFSQSPNDLRFAATEAFWYLIHNGFVTPGAPTHTTGFRDLGKYYLSPRGTAWVSALEPLPEDVNGYMKLLKALVPNLDSTMEQYVSQGLKSFERETYFAAAVMIGAAGEKAIYLLAESILVALNDVTRRSKLMILLRQRGLNAVFRFVEDTIVNAKAIPYDVTESSSRHLFSIFESIRVQRNDAVHPMKGEVTPESVRHSFNAFPHALETLERVRDWFLTHPNSI